MYSIVTAAVNESRDEVCTRKSMTTAYFSNSLKLFFKYCYSNEGLNFFHILHEGSNNTNCTKVLIVYHQKIQLKPKCWLPKKTVKVVCRKVSSAPKETVADEPEDAESAVWFFVWIGLGAVFVILFSCIVWLHWRSCMVSFKFYHVCKRTVMFK